MSANAAFLSCPVCEHASAFNSVESLRNRLICVSTKKITCPVCQEELIGLDKLTIHLFSHVKISKINSNSNLCENSDDTCSSKYDEEIMKPQTKKSRTSNSKNKQPPINTLSPVKFVKIYPKLPVISLKAAPTDNISQKETRTENQDLVTNAVKARPSKNDQSVLPNNVCNICGIQFVDENILRMHKCLIHNIDENSNYNLTRYNCHLCSKYFKMRGSLMVHLRVAHLGFFSGGNHAENKSDIISQGQDQNENKPLALERNDNKQWQCDVCKKCFTTKYFLKKHKRLHTGETPYACSQCNKTFTFQQSYHKHLLYHNDDKPHTCSFCGRAFKELSTLHNHQRIHTGEKPFSCETCGKCFRQRVSYLVHRRIHTGVMPYKCTACNKSFRYKVSQRTHKCLAQPPGIVVRQDCDDIVEKLKLTHSDNDKNYLQKVDELNKIQTFDSNQLHPQTDCVLQVSEANAELVRKGATLSLEDMESENFNIIADNFINNTCDILPGPSTIDTEKDLAIESNVDELINSVPLEDESVPSPSDILKNLCLSKEEDLISILQISNNN